MSVEKIHFLFTTQCFVASQRNDFNTRCHNQKCHVETYLVVACARTSVSNGISTNLLGIPRYSYSLKYTFGRN